MYKIKTNREIEGETKGEKKKNRKGRRRNIRWKKRVLSCKKKKIKECAILLLLLHY